MAGKQAILHIHTTSPPTHPLTHLSLGIFPSPTQIHTFAHDERTNVRWVSIHVRHHLKHWCISRQARRTAFPRSRSPRLSHAPLQTHLSCAEALLLRRRARITATLWASCVRIAFGCGCGKRAILGGFLLLTSLALLQRRKRGSRIRWRTARPACWCKTIVWSVFAMVDEE